MMALVLFEYAPEPVDINRVISMLLIHDIVEIDAGDISPHDDKARKLKEAREKRAAQRLFGLLPHDQRDRFSELWEEFEAKNTADSRFANMIDRLQPPLMNYAAGGGTWKSHQTPFQEVTRRISRFRSGLPALSHVVEAIVCHAHARGWIRSP